MFTAKETPTGTGYTTTVALLLVALVFVPAILVARLTVPSIAMHDARTK